MYVCCSDWKGKRGRERARSCQSFISRFYRTLFAFTYQIRGIHDGVFKALLHEKPAHQRRLPLADLLGDRPHSPRPLVDLEGHLNGLAILWVEKLDRLAFVLELALLKGATESTHNDR